MASLLEKKSTLWTLIGAAAVVLIIIVGSAIGGQRSPKTSAEPAATQPAPASPPAPAVPAPEVPPMAPAAPQPSTSIDTNVKAASDALSAYTAQSGNLSASGLDTQSADLDAAAQKFSP